VQAQDSASNARDSDSSWENVVGTIAAGPLLFTARAIDARCVAVAVAHSADVL